MRKLVPIVLVAVTAMIWVAAGCGGKKSGTSGGDGGNTEVPLTCGNGTVESPEECDPPAVGHGCSVSCKKESGWDCLATGGACKTICGDTIVTGNETCDEGGDPSGGCDSQCHVAQQDPTTGDGWNCPATGGKCTRALCGDPSAPMGNKSCDDYNGRPFDGCFRCKKEHSTAGNPTCGDGNLEDPEVCDDHGQGGCKEDCSGPNEGWTCQTESTTEPVTEIPVILRDFVGVGMTGQPTDVSVHPDFQAFRCDFISKGLVQEQLVNGKPAPTFADDASGLAYDNLDECLAIEHDQNGCEIGQCACGCTQTQVTSGATFKQWYEDDVRVDDKRVNMNIVSTLQLTEVPGMSGVYEYDSSKTPLGASYTEDEIKGYQACGSGLSECPNGFFPLDPLNGIPVGFGNLKLDDYDLPHNFSFTTEARVWFTYQGGEVLNFTGDDDVWIFINEHLAVDLGGLHPRRGGLPPANNPNGDPMGTVKLDDVAGSLGITTGKTYEMALFHAERHTGASNFKLMMTGFVTKTSVCQAGDGY